MSMHRELNPQLFGTNSTVEKIGNPVDPNHPAQGIMGRTEPAAPRQVPYPPIDVKAIEHSIATLKLALIQMEKRMEGLSSKMEELSRGTHGRLERFAQAIGRIEESQTRNNQEQASRFAQLVGRVNESKITDSKVTELVDRHNNIIRNFENRLMSLQRLVSEQEMALHNAQAALEESRNEIARLKRL